MKGSGTELESNTVTGRNQMPVCTSIQSMLLIQFSHWWLTVRLLCFLLESEIISQVQAFPHCRRVQWLYILQRSFKKSPTGLVAITWCHWLGLHWTTWTEPHVDIHRVSNNHHETTPTRSQKRNLTTMRLAKRQAHPRTTSSSRVQTAISDADSDSNYSARTTLRLSRSNLASLSTPDLRAEIGNSSPIQSHSHSRGASYVGFDASPGSVESLDNEHNGSENAFSRKRPVKRACNECRQQKVGAAVRPLWMGDLFPIVHGLSQAGAWVRSARRVTRRSCHKDGNLDCLSIIVLQTAR